MNLATSQDILISKFNDISILLKEKNWSIKYLKTLFLCKISLKTAHLGINLRRDVQGLYNKNVTL